MKTLILTFVSVSLSAQAAIQTLEAKGGQVQFLAKTKPSVVNVEGIGSPPTGRVTIDGKKLEGKFEFDLASLDTKMGLRNSHLKEKYLEVEKHPKAQLELTGVDPFEKFDVKNPVIKEAKFDGMLTLHGETKSVNGTLTVNEKSAVEARFQIKISDFNIAQPSFAGVTVKDEIDVVVTIDKLESEAK